MDLAVTGRCAAEVEATRVVAGAVFRPVVDVGWGTERVDGGGTVVPVGGRCTPLMMGVGFDVVEILDLAAEAVFKPATEPLRMRLAAVLDVDRALSMTALSPNTDALRPSVLRDVLSAPLVLVADVELRTGSAFLDERPFCFSKVEALIADREPRRARLAVVEGVDRVLSAFALLLEREPLRARLVRDVDTVVFAELDVLVDEAVRSRPHSGSVDFLEKAKAGMEGRRDGAEEAAIEERLGFTGSGWLTSWFSSFSSSARRAENCVKMFGTSTA